MEGQRVFLPVFVLVTSSMLALGEIRCYCNESGCVRTGYMCKSELGTCYTRVTIDRDTQEAIHGCVESLSVEQHQSCNGVIRESRDTQKTGDIQQSRGIEESQKPQKTQQKSRDTLAIPRHYLCCGSDMCNYKELINIDIVVRGKPTKNLTDRGVASRSSTSSVSVNSYSRHLWFRAAVIAVPIAGGCILVILVLLAVRMLRNDSRRHRQLMDMRSRQAYANSYVTRHFCEIDKKRGKANVDMNGCSGVGMCEGVRLLCAPSRVCCHSLHESKLTKHDFTQMGKLKMCTNHNYKRCKQLCTHNNDETCKCGMLCKHKICKCNKQTHKPTEQMYTNTKLTDTHINCGCGCSQHVGLHKYVHTQKVENNESCTFIPVSLPSDSVDYCSENDKSSSTKTQISDTNEKVVEVCEKRCLLRQASSADDSHTSNNDIHFILQDESTKCDTPLAQTTESLHSIC